MGYLNGQDILNIIALNQGKNGNKYDIPNIQALHELPDYSTVIGFNERNKRHVDKPNTGLHMYLEDYMINSIWNNPNKYIEGLRLFSFIIAPDYSLYRDMPQALQIYNTYRNRWVTAYLQAAGLIVLPSISWSDTYSYDYAFEGIPKGSIVSISTVGTRYDKKANSLFHSGLDAMLQAIEPKQLIVYGDIQGIEYPHTIQLSTLSTQAHNSRTREQASRQER